MVAEQVIQGKDGTNLHVRQFHCKEPKAQLIILHGYLEHCMRYVEFAEFLNKSAISVTLFDMRGHGTSGGKKASLDKWDDYLTDVDAVRTTLLPNVDTFLLGHSNGGLLLLDYILQGSGTEHDLSGIKGVILSNPYCEPSETLANPIKKAVGKFFGAMVPDLSIPSALSAEVLTSCPIKQEEHRNDPLNQKNAKAGWAAEGLRAQARVQQIAGSKTIAFPVLYVIADADVVASVKVNKKVSSELKAEDKTILIREGEKHEVLNEVNREELFETIANWILDKSA
ncbi:unnamed protein product [Cylindrotheca closterium]|uniref:Serine aminopeptidase S33 domain-containing protein n=1 Tax=Cylindrotheca closterium TaxID=2856 RepID=A0AAD2JP93_9STRA|nr:unnamed protein product [Cylindrotheca closterium]